ncbi:hypothetical protein LEMLEM_LOCUS26190 [Lemmus lemmus]
MCSRTRRVQCQACAPVLDVCSASLGILSTSYTTDSAPSPRCLSPGWNQTGNKFFNAKSRLIKLGKRKASVGSSGGRRSEMSCHTARANCRGLLLCGVFETFRVCLMCFIVYFIIHLFSTDLPLCQSPFVLLIIYE